MDRATQDGELARSEASLLDLFARANHLLTTAFQERLKEHGIAATEWRVLAALAERDGAAMTELADEVLLKQPTLTKAVDRLARDALVERRTPPEDRRRTLVHLTERGRGLALPLITAARQHERWLGRVLGEAESRALRAALRRVIECLAPLPQSSDAEPL
jgi:DNA-binding MarR family transcriptional regulator